METAAIMKRSLVPLRPIVLVFVDESPILAGAGGGGLGYSVGESEGGALLYLEWG